MSKENKKVSISKDTLQNLEKQMEKQQKEIEVLKTVADKKAMSRYYQRNKEELPTQVKLRTINGNVIAGWKLIKNEVYQDSQTGAWKEDQKVKLVFANSEVDPVEMPLMAFNRQYQTVKCKRVGVITDDKTEEEALKLVRLDNGKEYTINTKYVN